MRIRGLTIIALVFLLAFSQPPLVTGPHHDIGLPKEKTSTSQGGEEDILYGHGNRAAVSIFFGELDVLLDEEGIAFRENEDAVHQVSLSVFRPQGFDQLNAFFPVERSQLHPPEAAENRCEHRMGLAAGQQEERLDPGVFQEELKKIPALSVDMMDIIHEEQDRIRTSLVLFDDGPQDDVENNESIVVRLVLFQNEPKECRRRFLFDRQLVT